MIRQTVKISAVIPTCDRPHYLLEAIQSVRRQTLKPVEIIVVNNGKAPLPEGRVGNDVVILNLEPYVGVSAARNAGAKVAKGDLLAFLDDDDKWSSSFLEHLNATLNTENADYVVGDVYSFKHEAKFLEHYHSYAQNSYGWELSLEGKNPGFGGGNFLIKKEAFLHVGGFDESITMSEDQVLAVELALLGYKIIGEPKAHYYMRDHTEPRLRDKYVQYYLQFYKKLAYRMTIRQKLLYLLKTYKLVFKIKVVRMKKKLCDFYTVFRN
ncbi:MAG: hypothetical protein K0R24_1823 [Gammaproteobacteria bacterium]|jgi:GT2 family glycosyltransferase|nr:hypothetical protein [Gammaproteobacteria bacterium]